MKQKRENGENSWKIAGLVILWAGFHWERTTAAAFFWNQSIIDKKWNDASALRWTSPVERSCTWEEKKACSAGNTGKIESYQRSANAKTVIIFHFSKSFASALHWNAFFQIIDLLLEIRKKNSQHRPGQKTTDIPSENWRFLFLNKHTECHLEK